MSSLPAAISLLSSQLTDRTCYVPCTPSTTKAYFRGRLQPQKIKNVATGRIGEKVEWRDSVGEEWVSGEREAVLSAINTVRERKAKNNRNDGQIAGTAKSGTMGGIFEIREVEDSDGKTLKGEKIGINDAINEATKSLEGLVDESEGGELVKELLARMNLGDNADTANTALTANTANTANTAIDSGVDRENTDIPSSVIMTEENKEELRRNAQAIFDAALFEEQEMERQEEERLRGRRSKKGPKKEAKKSSGGGWGKGFLGNKEPKKKRVGEKKLETKTHSVTWGENTTHELQPQSSTPLQPSPPPPPPPPQQHEQEKTRSDGVEEAFTGMIRETEPKSQPQQQQQQQQQTQQIGKPESKPLKRKSKFAIERERMRQGLL